MTWDNLIDTILNVMVFAFIGLLIWLYFRPMGEDASNSKD
jgi:hypothetical protein